MPIISGGRGWSQEVQAKGFIWDRDEITPRMVDEFVTMLLTLYRL